MRGDVEVMMTTPINATGINLTASPHGEEFSPTKKRLPE
jgi:hypothetical protein